jgi:hypothetical protein
MNAAFGFVAFLPTATVIVFTLKRAGRAGHAAD